MKENVDMKALFDRGSKYHKSGDFDIDEHIRKIKGEPMPKANVRLSDKRGNLFPDVSASMFAWVFVAIFVAVTWMALGGMRAGI